MAKPTRPASDEMLMMEALSDVHEAIEPAHVSDSVGHEGGHSFTVGHVDHRRFHPFNPRQSIGVDVADRDHGAFGFERLGNGAAYARRACGDDDAVAFQS